MLHVRTYKHNTQNRIFSMFFHPTMAVRPYGAYRRFGLAIIANLLFIPLIFSFSTRNSFLGTPKQAPRRHDAGRAPPASNTRLQTSHDSSSNESSQTSQNLYTRYIQLLDTKPLLTKSISSGIVALLGDILAQSMEAQKAQHAPLVAFNWTRLLSFFICNTLYVGPFLHYWWEQLWKLGRWMQEKHGAKKPTTILVQLLLDQTIGVLMFFPTYFYAYELSESLLLGKGEQIQSCLSVVSS